jgi:hypothetical protein
MSLFQKNYLKIESKLIFHLLMLQIVNDNNYQIIIILLAIKMESKDVPLVNNLEKIKLKKL